MLFLLKKGLTDKTMVLQSWVFGKDFLQSEQSEPVTSRKTAHGICCQWYNSNFKEKMRILENLSLSLCAWERLNGERLSCHISEDINKCDFLILNNKRWQHVERLHNSVNQYFPNDQCLILRVMLQMRDVTNAWCYKMHTGSCKAQHPPIEMFFLFLAAPRHMEFLGQGSDPGCSCNPSYSWGNTGSLTHCVRLGIKSAPQRSQMLLIPLPQWALQKTFMLQIRKSS